MKKSKIKHSKQRKLPRIYKCTNCIRDYAIEHPYRVHQKQCDEMTKVRGRK